VGYNDIDRHTWLGHNFLANALEDIRANHLVFGVLACQGTRSAINFRPGGERYCQGIVIHKDNHCAYSWYSMGYARELEAMRSAEMVATMANFMMRISKWVYNVG
jgi:hypothetical protein